MASALDARNRHDIDRFDHTQLTSNEKNEIVNSWLHYIEDKVLEEESMTSLGPSFSKSYMLNKSIQKKYLEVNNVLAIPISNSIRFLFNYKELMKLKFSIHKMGISWRHVILVVISEIYKEQIENKQSYIETKGILANIMPEKSLTGLSEKALIETILNLWKIVR